MYTYILYKFDYEEVLILVDMDICLLTFITHQIS